MSKKLGPNLTFKDLETPSKFIDSSSPFYPLAKKAERAIASIEEISKLEAGFWSNLIMQTETRIDPTTGDKLIYLAAKDGAKVPEELPILAGEVLYQIRSSYDILIQKIAEIEALQKNRRRYFPLGDNKSGFEKSVEMNCGDFPERWKKTLLETGVYYGKNEIVREIFRLNNKDKHADIIAFFPEASIRDFRTGIVSGVKTLFSGSQGDLENGILLYHLHPNGEYAPTKYEEYTLTGHLVFRDTSIPNDGSLVNILHMGAVGALSNFLLRADQMRLGHM